MTPVSVAVEIMFFVTVRSIVAAEPWVVMVFCTVDSVSLHLYMVITIARVSVSTTVLVVARFSVTVIFNVVVNVAGLTGTVSLQQQTLSPV